ncbi:serine palmitoyltransferase [Rhizoclosmatium globosum]|uniref:serine C-palmitoyltransferase n=1 Tax=Rhizoclosmatium globosum TaxID=329046 RepID=A0A1Y2D0P5_9FUNG|nr:serine palmitoyltransferase [Rhizoclosmatium globosum]|eukprot:ORY52863.1 serine palmitoyltransferase [Rhizoclosmatium globosum]
MVVAVNTTFTLAYDVYSNVPGAAVVYKYIRDSHQNDPVRTLLELVFVVVMAWYFFNNKPKAKDEVKLTEKEIQDLCDEWEPEELVPRMTEFQNSDLENMAVIAGAAGTKCKLADGKERLNFASNNFIGVMNSESIKDKAIGALHKYGVGSCGPPGFYGTLDVHMELEQAIARFLGVESSIIYSQGFSTVSSVIPAFSKRSDILVVDDACGMAILKGVELSRSIVKFYRHNDMKDLENVLKKINESTKKKPLTRRFIITEGVFQAHGDMCNLPVIMALKEQYKYRLILEDSLGFGCVGQTGRGTPEHFGIAPADVDIYCATMANSLSSSGGFCAGRKEIVEHQRLSGLAYTFSASLPAILAVSALEALKILEANPNLSVECQQNAMAMREILLKAGIPQIRVADGYQTTPIIHIRLTSRLSTREEEELVLQEVVDQCIRDGVIVSRAKYVEGQELHLPVASVKLMASAGHTRRDSEKAAGIVRDAFRKVLKAHRLA